MNRNMREFRRLFGKEIFRRRIYSRAYSRLNGEKVRLDEENLGISFRPEDEKGGCLMSIVDDLLYKSDYTLKEFYSQLSKKGVHR